MTDERVERAFREHPDFEQTGENEFETAAKPFETVVLVTEGEDDDGGETSGESSREYRVAVRTPMLDAVVEGETVAEVVESGWFETLERRLEDVHTVAQSDATPPSIERERREREDGVGGEAVVVTVEFESSDPEQAVEDALAVAEYVEGTWIQGIIPGYDYREPAASLLERARQNYDEGGSDGPGGASDSSAGGPGPGGTGPR
jgi:hypothetical protein